MKRVPLLAAILLGMAALAIAANAAAPSSVRQTISLNGEWEFQRDGAPATDWKSVTVPSSFESHEGPDFNGVGWYRKRVPAFDLPPGRRALIHFQAAATEAEVWWNGARLGSHLGGWTPFRFDITELVRQAPAGQAHELRVRLDEKVGHNTQGFLPIIAPHFGGLWQEVELLLVPDTYGDDLRLLAVGDVGRSEFHLELPLLGTPLARTPVVSLHFRLRGEDEWRALAARSWISNGVLSVVAPLADPWLWSPTEPHLYELRLRVGGEDGDLIETRAAFRQIEVFGPQLRLNGEPLQVRGLLNWGYSAPRTEPNPGEAVWQRELELARGLGFNLMKFCLWVPPRRYHELADELGILTWAECPTWHPKLTSEFLEPLEREFGEFFYYDRNHPSVILRSLTCETGPGAELKVIQRLYDLAKRLVPGAVVVDDSSWIGWNRVHDFYDDHPYGNNHTWVKTLQGFNAHILAHGLKPLVLGEAIAADTWMDHEAILARVGSERPWWVPGPLDEVPRWRERMRAIAGPGGLDRLLPDSLRYGLLMRKFQIEAFRREVPFGGYVVSVIRDIPLCSMGLVDYLDQPKWSEAEWAWHRDTMCLLKTTADRRSFMAGERLRGEILLSHFGPAAITDGTLEVTLETLPPGDAPMRRAVAGDFRQPPGTLARRLELDWELPIVETPTHLRIRAVLRAPGAEAENTWPVWIVPRPRADLLDLVRIHDSLEPAAARELFASAPAWSPGETDAVIVAARLDEALASALERGARVLLLPDGERNSFPLHSHWFLRGAPFVPEPGLPPVVPRDLLLELQHFDLASRVVPDPPYLEYVDPLLLLWDTHDLKTVKTHGLIFETRVGEGRLLVSAVNHRGAENAVGRWLLGVLVERLRSPVPPRNALPPPVWAAMKQHLNAEQTSLVERVWRFRPDPRDEGLRLGWHHARLDSEAGWSDIRIGTAWESQGHPTLDGWAWYRLSVEVPARWRDRPVYLSFAGVDDMYELYLNGELVAKRGDLATRTDTFAEEYSHDISDWARPGEPLTIAVRVHDWHGAGGIHRPVTLGTADRFSGVAVLK